MTRVVGRLARVVRRWLQPLGTAQGALGWLQSTVVIAVLIFGSAAEAIRGQVADTVPQGLPSAIILLLLIAVGLIASYRQEAELDSLISGRPRLSFGQPKLYQRELMDLVRTRQLSEGIVEELPGPFGIQWCRVSLTNDTPGTAATNVRVRISSEPPLDYFPVEAHEKGGINPPYSIRHGETLEFDVLGRGDDGRAYLSRSSRHPDGFVHPVDDPRTIYDGFVLKLAAIADPPAEGDVREYRLGGYSILEELISGAT